MAIQPQQTSWTDRRLDDLNQSIRDGFARNDREHQEFRQEMQRCEPELNDQFHTLHRVMIAGLFTCAQRSLRLDFSPSLIA